jgi:hypothetical protein
MDCVTMSTPEYISITKLSAISGLSVSTLRRRVKDGSLPVIQPGGRRSRLLFRRDVLDTLSTVAHESTSTPAPSAEEAPCEDPTTPAVQPLPGPRPRWTRSHNN